MNECKIGKNIRIIRKRRGLSLDDVADVMARKTGDIFSANAIGAWQRGERTPSPFVLRSLCYALDCSIYELYYPERMDADRMHRVQNEVDSLEERHRESILFIISEWPGNLPPLIEADRAYAMLPPDRRRRVVECLLDQVQQARTAGQLRNDIEIHTDVIMQGMKRLEAMSDGGKEEKVRKG